MNTIWDIFLFFLFVADKSRNGSLRPDDVSFSLEAGQQLTYDKYWQDGKGKTKASAEALQAFLQRQPVTSDGTGLLALPADFAHERMIWRGKLSGADFVQYLPVTSDGLRDALRSRLNKIEANPRFMESENGLQLYPAIPHSVTLEYYKTPDSPKIGYTTPAADPVYDAASSTQLGFRKKYWLEVIHHSMPYVGVNLSAPELYALAKEYQPKMP